MAMSISERARLEALERQVAELLEIVTAGNPAEQATRKKPGPKPKVANDQAAD